MANETKLTNLVNPQVMADMISATLPKMIKFTPIAHVNTTLVGRAGNTITIPKYAYIGDAVDVAEGVAMGTTVLTASTTQATVKKGGKAVEITDEARLSGYGDPVGEATRQLGMSIASKVDTDAYDELCTATLTYTDANKISYAGVTNANSKFGDEHDNVLAKVLYINPEQEATILLDSNFIDKNKYGVEVVMTGAIGKIAGCEVVKSKKVKKDSTDTYWMNPIVIVTAEDPDEDPSADGVATQDSALTIYLKHDVEVETDRDILKNTTVISADEHYTVKLTNESKVVLAKFKVQ